MIDSRRKRQNVAAVGFLAFVSVLPTGSVDSFERVQAAWTYAGISITPPPAPPTPPVPWLVPGPTHADFYQIHDFPAFS